MTPVGRRGLLATAGSVIALIGIAWSGSRAMGFTLKGADTSAGADAGGRCGPRNAVHDSVVADILQQLEGRPVSEITAALADAVCPYCGCRIG